MDMNNYQEDEQESEVYMVSDIQKKLRCSKNMAYTLVRRGQAENLFSVIKIGKDYRISRKSFDYWFNNQHQMTK